MRRVPLYLPAVAWFTDADLRDLAGPRSYERGLAYADVVTGVGDLPDGVVATVHGHGRYRVRLTGGEDQALEGECSCPYGQDGNFCKHCVAVGLHLLRDDAPPKTPGKQTGLEAFLATMDHAELVEVVLRHASEDPGLFQKLRLLAATAGGPDLAELRRQVAALRVEWVEYGDGHAYATGAREVLAALGRLAPDHAGTMQSLLRRALTHIGAAATATDDESGTIIEVADEAWEAYLRSCEAEPPDPVELAEWYADFRLDGPEWPSTSLDDVIELLGDEGLAAYRERLDRATQTHGGKWRLGWLREELVAATGDVDAMVACLAEDLSGPHRYVRIAELLSGEGRLAEAIEWLERGSAGDGEMTHLVDLLAKLYAEDGRAGEVVALRERHFTAARSQRTYHALRGVAQDTPQWSEIRERALALLRRSAASKGWFAADTLAAVLLDEGEVDEAWQVTHSHTCTEQVRLSVTARRAETHPADAVAVYRPLVEAAVAQTDNRGYKRAAQLLVTMRPLFARTGGNFAGYVGALKEANRRKRNFLAELARNGL